MICVMYVCDVHLMFCLRTRGIGLLGGYAPFNVLNRCDLTNEEMGRHRHLHLGWFPNSPNISRKKKKKTWCIKLV